MTRAESDEMTQDLVLRLAEEMRRFDPSDPRATFQTWMSRQLAWGVADFWRARDRERRRRSRLETEVDAELIAGPEEEPRVVREELQRAVRDCLAKLSPTQRDRLVAALELRDQSRTQRDLADQLRISLDALKESLELARTHMRRCLQRKGWANQPPLRDGNTRSDSSDEH